MTYDEHKVIELTIERTFDAWQGGSEETRVCAMDEEEMQETLNAYARERWKLVSVATRSDGVMVAFMARKSA